MSLSYACLQLGPEEPVEAARERIIYAVTAEMERQGLIPCERPVRNGQWLLSAGRKGPLFTTTAPTGWILWRWMDWAKA